MDYLTRRIINHLASRDGHGLTDAETQFLLSASRDQNRQTARCDVDRMRALLRHEPELIKTIGPAALHVAVQYQGTEAAVELLLEQGVRSLDLGPGEESPLHMCVRNDNLAALRLVLDAGITDASSVIDQPTPEGLTNLSLLYWVAHQGLDTAYVDLLLRHGADPRIPIVGNGERGTSVLQEAVAHPVGPGGTPSIDPVWIWRKQEVARHLVGRRGVKYDLYSAAGLDDLDQLKSLVTDRDKAAEPGEGGMTPLHWAARGDAGECAGWLLKQKVDPDCTNLAQRTPLHMAADWNHADMIFLLVGAGADIDAVDTHGRTPLHRAASLGRVEATEVLLLLEADQEARDGSDRTPAQVARDGCVQLLQ